MATYLYRLGRWSYDRRRTVLALWLAVLVGVGALAAAFGGTTNNKFEVPGTESQQAQELLEQQLPGSQRLLRPCRLRGAFGRDARRGTGRRRRVADGGVRSRGGLPRLRGSSPARTARSATPTSSTPPRRARSPTRRARSSRRRRRARDSRPAGRVLRRHRRRGGRARLRVAGHDRRLLRAGDHAWRRCVAAGHAAADRRARRRASASTSLTALSGVIDLSETAPVLATMLGLAVGIDYALFILARHRQNLGDGMRRASRRRRPSATAGSAVVFAGIDRDHRAGRPVRRQHPVPVGDGPGRRRHRRGRRARSRLTLLPALLGFAGDAARPAQPRPHAAGAARRADERPLGRLRHASSRCRAARRPALLVVVAIPATHMKLGLPDGSSEPDRHSTERRSYDLLTEGFGPGFNGPLTVVVDAPGSPAPSRRRSPSRWRRRWRASRASPPSPPPCPTRPAISSIVQVTPESGPAARRDQRPRRPACATKADELPKDAGIAAYVTGQTAINIDTAAHG